MSRHARGGAVRGDGEARDDEEEGELLLRGEAPLQQDVGEQRGPDRARGVHHGEEARACTLQVTSYTTVKRPEPAGYK